MSPSGLSDVGASAELRKTDIMVVKSPAGLKDMKPDQGFFR